MLRDKVKKYFLDEERNCAESMLMAANEEYNIGLSESEMELMRGFGGAPVSQMLLFPGKEL